MKDMEASHSPATASTGNPEQNVIGTFLQEKMRSRVFVKIHKIYGELFP